MAATSTAFGLDIEAAVPLSFLSGSTVEPTGRPLALSVHPQQKARASWPDRSELICDDRTPDGSLNFSIESDPDAGYLFTGPDYGAHLLSVDGRRLRCFPEARPEGAWQRLLIAQVLPFAALLHGLEVFHASAVVRDGRAIAFLGPSRSGKTSLALELCARGASFLTDDVLALEARDGRLLANPGTPVAGIAHREDGEPRTGQRAGVVAVNARERVVQMATAPRPAPLEQLYFLDRSANGPATPRFEHAKDAQLLLAATFNFVLATPARLEGLLEVSALAAHLQVELLSTGPASGTAQLADAIESRSSSSR